MRACGNNTAEGLAAAFEAGSTMGEWRSWRGNTSGR